VINLTIKEKNDLNEVYNCLLVNNRFDSILMILRTIIGKAHYQWLESSSLQTSKATKGRIFRKKSM